MSTEPTIDKANILWPGDIVRLKSGGPELTVAHTYRSGIDGLSTDLPDDRAVWVVWHAVDGTLQRTVIDCWLLDMVSVGPK